MRVAFQGAGGRETADPWYEFHGLACIVRARVEHVPKLVTRKYRVSGEMEHRLTQSSHRDLGRVQRRGSIIGVQSQVLISYCPQLVASLEMAISSIACILGKDLAKSNVEPSSTRQGQRNMAECVLLTYLCYFALSFCWLAFGSPAQWWAVVDASLSW